MDSNNTRFHLLLGQPDWSRCIDGDGMPILSASPPGSAFGWEEASHSLTLRPELFDFPDSDATLTLDQRRGAAFDPFGNLYWISETKTEIRVRSAGGGSSTHFWSSADMVGCEPEAASAFKSKPYPLSPTPYPLSFSGLTVTSDHCLIIGVPDYGLLVFDLFGGGPPRELLWPGNFSPFEIAARPGGGVLILEGTLQDNALLNPQLWVLDQKLDLDPKLSSPLAAPRLEVFQPKEGQPRTIMPQLQAQPFALPEGTVAIEALSCDEALLLVRQARESFLPQAFHYLRLGQAPIEIAVDWGHLPRLAFRPAHDLAWVPPQGACPAEEDRGQVFLATDDGNQALHLKLKQEGTRLKLYFDPCFFPLRRFSGKAIVRTEGRAFYDFAERWLPIVAQARPRHAAQATLLTPLLDGKEPGCVWHRLMLDAELPSGSEVKVWSRANDDPELLEQMAWSTEPSPYPRSDGPELPYVRQAEGFKTWELLFQQARGQYLQVKLELLGDGRSTPCLRALRAYYPRFSYLHYLPAVYRQDPNSASFVERFLANLEGLYTTLEDRIAAVQTLFDAAGAPKESLDWLAAWFGLALDPAWKTTPGGEAKQRFLIQNAMTFLQYRGTLGGVYMALRLMLEEQPDLALFEQPRPQRDNRSLRLIERFSTRLPLRLNPQSDCRQTPTPLWKPDSTVDLNLLYSSSYQFNQTEWNLDPGLPSLFPLSRPEEPEGAFWEGFCHHHLGFVPSASPSDRTRWQEFLRRRYRLESLKAQHSTTYTSFEEIDLPTELRNLPALLHDWYEFETLFLPLARSAHRFSVLLPVPAGGNAQSNMSALELARRIVDLEKPAHTVFDLDFYWAMFRLGEARLGLDSLLDSSSRTAPLRLGQGYLAEGYLAPFIAETPGRIRLGGGGTC